MATDNGDGSVQGCDSSANLHIGRLTLPAESLDILSQYCSEFLVHAADVEGLCQGIDEDLVRSVWPFLYFKHVLTRFP